MYKVLLFQWLSENDIGAIISYSNGFLCSFGDKCVFVFEQMPVLDENIKFNVVRKIKFPNCILNEADVNQVNNKKILIQGIYIFL